MSQALARHLIAQASVPSPPAIDADAVGRAKLDALRQRYAADIGAFARERLPIEFYLDVPPAPLHVDLLDVFARIQTATRSIRVVREGPRGHAKTTYLAKVLPAHIACHPERWPEIRLHAHFRTKVSDARKDLRGLRERLESPEIREVYGDLRTPGGKWNEDYLEFASGYTVYAMGAEQCGRGLNDPVTGARPNLITIDDIDKDAQSLGVRDKILDWIKGALLGMRGVGRPMHIVLTGTCVDAAATTRAVGELPGFEFETYAAIEQLPDRLDLWDRWERVLDSGARDAKAQARGFYEANRADMDAGATGLWEGDPLYDVMEDRWTMGPVKFAAEKLNRPRAGDAQLVDPAELRWFCPDGGEFVPPEAGQVFGGRTPAKGRSVVVLDPATGKRKGDWHSIVGGWSDVEGRLWAALLDVSRCRKEDLAGRACDMVEDVGASLLAYEAVGGYEWLGPLLRQEVARRGLTCAVEERRPPPQVSKTKRLEELGPLLRRGRIVLGRSFAGEGLAQIAGLDELGRHPKGGHDDVPDALWYFKAELDKPKVRAKRDLLPSGGRGRNGLGDITGRSNGSLGDLGSVRSLRQGWDL